MSAAKVNGTTVTRLDGKADPEEVVSEDDVKDPAKLSKMLARALATIAALRRVPAPKRIDFEDCAVVTATGTTLYLEHGFSGRVRWWVCDTSTGVNVKRNTATTADMLVLDVTPDADGTCTVRVEAAG